MVAASRGLSSRLLQRAVEAEQRAVIAEDKLKRIAEVYTPEWLYGKILPAYLGSEADAREEAVLRILKEKK